MIGEWEIFLNKWLDGLYNEIAYWNRYLSGKCSESCWLAEASNPYKRFELEDELPDDKDRTVKFVDIGAGAFSRCGKITDKVKLSVLAVDPLAEVYKILKRQYHVENGIAMETGYVELLDRKFEKNTFDIVHMSNALDHCFDAVFGIYQLLNICKVGGKVILRHHENTAELEGYRGLHQWNLSLHNKESSFIIWREDKRYDVCKLFSEYATISLYPDIREEKTNWIYNKVVMIKKKEIVIPPNKYADMFLESVYKYLVRTLFDNFVENANRLDEQRRILCEKIDKANMELVQSRLKGNKVIIYGMGKIGQKLIDYLSSENGIEIVGIIDKRKVIYKTYQSVSIDETTEMDKELPIIVTVPNDYMQIEDDLKANGWNNILKVEHIIE